MKINEIITEDIDKNAINAVLTKIRSGRFVSDLTGEDYQVLRSLIAEAKQKLITLINSNGKIRSDWVQVKKFIDKYKSQIMMASWDTWFRTGGEGIIRQDPKQDKIAILTDPKMDEILVVYPDMYNILQWRFLIDHLDAGIMNQKLNKPVAQELIKLKSLLAL